MSISLMITLRLLSYYIKPKLAAANAFAQERPKGRRCSRESIPWHLSAMTILKAH
jgi:hypothetical protein